MSGSDAVVGVVAETCGDMTLDVDALRRFIAAELVGTGLEIPAEELARIATAVLDEAVRISLEWVEAELPY